MAGRPDVAKHDDLIYDVGLHRGEDTDYYLQKGFRVVAVEANPQLVDECTARFAREIADGKFDNRSWSDCGSKDNGPKLLFH